MSEREIGVAGGALTTLYETSPSLQRVVTTEKPVRTKGPSFLSNGDTCIYVRKLLLLEEPHRSALYDLLIIFSINFFHGVRVLYVRAKSAAWTGITTNL